MSASDLGPFSSTYAACIKYSIVNSMDYIILYIIGSGSYGFFTFDQAIGYVCRTSERCYNRRNYSRETDDCLLSFRCSNEKAKEGKFNFGMQLNKITILLMPSV